jgi:tetratricopeptide (TPR) repeat protein
MRHFPTALEAAELAVSIAMSMNENKSVLTDSLLTAGEVLSEIEGRERDVVIYLQQFTQIARKPLGIDVTWSRVYEMLGDAYFKIGQHQAAVNAYQSALQFNPYHPWEQLLHYRAARSYYQLGEYEKSVGAIQRMQQSAEADGQPISDYRVYQVLGNAQYALGQYNLAAQAYQSAIESAPPSAEIEPIKHYLHLCVQLSDAV